jgi:hypothetical protein
LTALQSAVATVEKILGHAASPAHLLKWPPNQSSKLSLIAAWVVSLLPIFQLKSRHSAEFRCIVRNKRQARCQRDSRDHQVIWADYLTADG